MMSTALFSQSEYDAIKFSDNDINGSARFMGMAGAFGSLGGDASAVGINPAGLGIYRGSELSFGTNLQFMNSQANTNAGQFHVSDLDFTFNNFNFVINFGKNETKQKGLITSSFAFGFNKLKNFDREIYGKAKDQEGSMTDYIANLTTSNGDHYLDMQYDGSYNPFNGNNANAPWLGVMAYQTFLIDTIPGTTNQYQSLLGPGELVNPSYLFSEEGYINEWSFAYGGNISNKLYFGAKIGIRDLQYNSHTKYSEEFENGGSMSLSNSIETTGTGFNFSAGLIARPVKFLRLGAAFHTPTFYTINTLYSAVMSSSLSNNYTQASPIGSQSYLLRTPYELDLSGALIFGKVGLLSFDYEYKDFSSSKLEGTNWDGASLYQDNNAYMDTCFNKVQTLRLGAEVKITKEFAIRFGVAGKTPIVNDDKKLLLYSNTTTSTTQYMNDKTLSSTSMFSTRYITGGFGYREENWFVDFACVFQKQSQEFNTYTATNNTPYNILSYTNNFVATLGFRF